MSHNETKISSFILLNTALLCYYIMCIHVGDLKPENFLLKDESENAPVKIIDFGLSRKDDAPFGGSLIFAFVVFGIDSKCAGCYFGTLRASPHYFVVPLLISTPLCSPFTVMCSRVGTPYYVAPEVLLHEYTYKVDIWSIGVIAYILLCGFAPFSGETDVDTLHLVQSGDLEFPSPEWDDISDEAKDFIRKLLDRDPDRRPTAAQALHHPWISKHVVEEPGVPKPKPFGHRRGVSDASLRISMNSDRRFAFKKLLDNVKVEKNLRRVASVLTPSEASFLARVFRKVDKDNDGRITTEDIDKAVQAGSLTSSVRDNLQELRSALQHSTRKSTFDITPFIAMAEEKSIPE
jgi:calcium-dependent protein kinase